MCAAATVVHKKAVEGLLGQFKSLDKEVEALRYDISSPLIYLFIPTSLQTFKSLLGLRLPYFTYFSRDSQHKDLTQKEIANARLQVCLSTRMYQIRNPLLLLVLTARFMIR